MSNKYVRGLVIVLVGMVILLGLLFIGDLIAVSQNATDRLIWEPGERGILGWWLTWVIIGGVVLYLANILFSKVDMFKVGMREVVIMAIGAAAYGILSWFSNSVPVPSIDLVALRPVVVIPIFFGFAFGPAVGFFVGAFGNILGDALSGWGVYPIWDVANGFMGLVPGLAGMYFGGKTFEKTRIGLVISTVVLLIATALVWLYPNISSQLTGEPVTAFRYMMPAILIITVGLALVPRLWPYVLLALLVAFIGYAANYVISPPSDLTGDPLGGAAFLGLIVVACGVAAFYVHGRARNLAKWSDETDTTTIAVWAILGVIIGIGFAAIADIFYNGYDIPTAIVGEFVPAAGPNILFGVILTPLLYAAWKQRRVIMGR